MKSYANENILTPHKSNSSGGILRAALPGALFGGILLIAYFLIVKALGYHHQTNLRWINFVIIVPISAFAISSYIRNTKGKTYLSAFIHSISACLGSYFILAIFMLIYLLIDQSFMNELRNLAYPELQLNQLSIFLLIMGEGVLGSVVVSFVVLQFFKDSVRNAA
ncbi:MAG TPA: hypothetical protein PKD91_01055 [Bacteroidia bacterium]|nr:hypothetical protein [Bacteroidia bacterium]